MMADNHITDLLPAFALDSLTGEEANQVVTHLADCPTCQAELARLQRVADELPLALHLNTPPPEVKSRLMNAIHAQQTITPAPKPASIWEQIGHALRSPLPAISLALILILALGNLLLWRQIRLNSPQVNTLMRVIALANTENSPDAIGTLVMDPHGKYGTLVVDNLSILTPDKQYQIWLSKGTDRISGGLFSVNGEGYASVEIFAPSPLVSYDSIGISVEPAGGSPQPTGERIMGGDLFK